MYEVLDIHYSSNLYTVLHVSHNAYLVSEIRRINTYSLMWFQVNRASCCEWALRKSNHKHWTLSRSNFWQSRSHPFNLGISNSSIYISYFDNFRSSHWVRLSEIWILSFNPCISPGHFYTTHSSPRISPPPLRRLQPTRRDSVPHQTRHNSLQESRRPATTTLRLMPDVEYR